MSPTEGSRLARWRGLVGVALHRLVARRGPGPRLATGAVVAVAVTLAVVLLVTSVSLGLATQGTVRSADVDYWVVPEERGDSDAALGVSGPRLGDVHGKAAAVQDHPDVRFVTPVLVEVVQVNAPNSEEPAYVLAVGVVPPDRPTTVAGVSTEPLSSGDPHYAKGTYEGPFTGDVVLSPAAASILNASVGDSLAVSSSKSLRVGQTFAVDTVDERRSNPAGEQVPIALFRLSELQEYTGAAEHDQADQLLVGTNSPALQSDLERAYPDATIVAREGVTPGQGADDDLALAVGLTGLAVAVTVVALFVTTTAGIVVERDRRTLAILGALGFSRRARLALVAVTTVALSTLGATLGVVLAALGSVVLNAAVGAAFGVGTVARFDPMLVVYGVAVGVLAGLVAAPYPVALAWRTDVAREVAR